MRVAVTAAVLEAQRDPGQLPRVHAAVVAATALAAAGPVLGRVVITVRAGALNYYDAGRGDPDRQQVLLGGHQHAPRSDGSTGSEPASTAITTSASASQCPRGEATVRASLAAIHSLWSASTMRSRSTSLSVFIE